jgi:hypothetical protein
VDDLDSLELSCLDFSGAEGRDPTREFGTVQVANPHNVLRRKFAFAPGNPRRQKALATFTQRFSRPGIDEQCSLGMMKKSYPTLASTQTGRLWHK